MKEPTRDRINRNFELLENLKDSLISNISNLSQEKLQKRPSPNSWNLVEFTNHLMYVENYALTQISGNLNQRIRKPLVDRVRFFVVRRVLASNMKVKVPVKAVDPSNCDTSLENTLMKWAQTRLTLRQLINNISGDALNYCYFHHPYAGRFTINDGLVFLIDHWYHHRKQFNTLLDL